MIHDFITILQVRCMAAVLLMVGRHLEQPEIVQQLLDVQQNPCKPQYNYASEVMTVLTSWHLSTSRHMSSMLMRTMYFSSWSGPLLSRDNISRSVCVITGTPFIFKVLLSPDGLQGI